MSTINIAAALRPLFADPDVQRYLRDHDPATLDAALSILRYPDDEITPLEVVTLAYSAGTRNQAGSPSPFAHPGIGDKVTTALARAGIPNLPELFAMARAQSDAFHVAEEARFKPGAGDNPNSQVAAAARMGRSGADHHNAREERKRLNNGREEQRRIEEARKADELEAGELNVSPPAG